MKWWIEKTDTCWWWRGRLDANGYGRIGYARAHVVVYTIIVGVVPSGLVLDHLCRNKACVRPDHLEPVTHRVNILRGNGLAATNARKTHCKRGHLLVETNIYRKPSGARACRTCALAQAARWQKEHKEAVRERTRRYRERQKAKRVDHL